MASSDRDGDSTGRNKSGSKSPSEKKLKLSAEEFWQLSFLQKKVENTQLMIDGAEKSYENSGLRRRIHELERLLLHNKISLLKQKTKDSDKELKEYRKQIAQNLGLETLDEYIVDTESFELKHEQEI